MRSSRAFPVFVFIVTATYILFLGATNRLNLYIHPRYIFFTVVMAAIALVLAWIAFLTNEKGSFAHKSSSWSVIPLIAMLAFALLLPARTLTSATVSQRLTDGGSLVQTTETVTNSVFLGSTKSLKITDWSRLLKTNTDPGYYTNKPVNISGFIYDANLGSDTVWLARFVLTCCAVDSQPVGVPVRIEGWAAEYEEDDWLQVSGEFTLLPTSNGEELVLLPESVERIEEPGNPYAN